MIDETVLIATAIGSAIGAVGGGTVAGAISALMNSAQRKRLDRLENDRIVKIENSLEKMRRSGCSVGVMVKTRLETIVAQNNRIILELNQLNRETGEQSEAISRNTVSLKRAHERLDEHLETYHHA